MAVGTTLPPPPRCPPPSRPSVGVGLSVCGGVLPGLGAGRVGSARRPPRSPSRPAPPSAEVSGNGGRLSAGGSRHPATGLSLIGFPSVSAGAYKRSRRGARRAERGVAHPPLFPPGPMQPAMMMFSSKYWARRGFSLDSALPEERPAGGGLTVSGGAGSGALPAEVGGESRWVGFGGPGAREPPPCLFALRSGEEFFSRGRRSEFGRPIGPRSKGCLIQKPLNESCLRNPSLAAGANRAAAGIRQQHWSPVQVVLSA